jgi:hypothetical protein
MRAMMNAKPGRAPVFQRKKTAGPPQDSAMERAEAQAFLPPPKFEKTGTITSSDAQTIANSPAHSSAVTIMAHPGKSPAAAPPNQPLHAGAAA